jgi:hypothetical protein
MVRDGELDFLDEKNLMKLEHMRKDAKTVFTQGAACQNLKQI